MDFVHPEDVSKTKKIGLEITQGKSTRDFQNRYLKKDGTEVHMMWSAIWSETDGLLYAVARDMTTSIRISEELKSYEELMNLAGDISNIGGWTIDLDTKKFFWTRQVYKILEFPEGSPPSWNQRLKLYTPESRIAFLDAVKNCKMHGKSFDLKLETKTKKSRWINTRLIGNPIRNNEGKVVRLAGAIQDITAQTMQEKNLIAAKEAAISANAAKDVFLSTMSHEIRTPLNGLLGMLELLSFTKLETEQRENLKVALDSGRNLIRIINDLLDHAKIEAGKLQFVNEPNSINELITRLELSYIPIASSKNISLTKYVDSALSPFHVFDSLRLTQILGNLISNAIKFTDNGNVKIVASLISRSADEEKIALRVTDSGIGISEDAKTRLFTHLSKPVRILQECMEVPD
jgi:signal transduction histidine kinase